jgi:hypothetical protein
MTSSFHPHRVVMPTLVLLLAASSFTGCRYVQNRVDDLQDSARLGLEFGPQFGVHAEATVLMHTGVGFGIVPATTNTGYGVMGRYTPFRYQARSFDLVFMHYRALDGYPENLCHFSPLIPGETSTHQPRDYPPIDWLDTELAAYCVFGARVGVNPGQFVDFLAGLFTLDLAGDDTPAATEKKKRSHTPAIAPARHPVMPRPTRPSTEHVFPAHRENPPRRKSEADSRTDG